MDLHEKYTKLCYTVSDINEHLPTLKILAEDCKSVFETGVRGCISSWALLYGLTSSSNRYKGEKKTLFMNDIDTCDIQYLLNYIETMKNTHDINVKYEWCNNLTLNLTENYDLTFIDTWHVYGQLKRELDKFAPITNKYIVMHDTTVDGIHGESIRCKLDYKTQSLMSGFPEDQILKGLKPAINEFLAEHPEWVVKAEYINNNGLTILERITL